MNRFLSFLIPLVILILAIVALIGETTRRSDHGKPNALRAGEYRGATAEKMAWIIEERDGIPHRGAVADPDTGQEINPFEEEP